MAITELELLKQSKLAHKAINLGHITEAEFNKYASPEQQLSLTTYRNAKKGRLSARAIASGKLTEEEIKLQPEQFTFLQEYRKLNQSSSFSTVPGIEQLTQATTATSNALFPGVEETISNVKAFPAVVGQAIAASDPNLPDDSLIAFKLQTGKPLSIQESLQAYKTGAISLSDLESLGFPINDLRNSGDMLGLIDFKRKTGQELTPKEIELESAAIDQAAVEAAIPGITEAIVETEAIDIEEFGSLTDPVTLLALPIGFIVGGAFKFMPTAVGEAVREGGVGFALPFMSKIVAAVERDEIEPITAQQLLISTGVAATLGTTFRSVFVGLGRIKATPTAGLIKGVNDIQFAKNLSARKALTQARLKAEKEAIRNSLTHLRLKAEKESIDLQRKQKVDAPETPVKAEQPVEIEAITGAGAAPTAKEITKDIFGGETGTRGSGGLNSQQLFDKIFGPPAKSSKLTQSIIKNKTATIKKRSREGKKQAQDEIDLEIKTLDVTAAEGLKGFFKESTIEIPFTKRMQRELIDNVKQFIDRDMINRFMTRFNITQKQAIVLKNNLRAKMGKEGEAAFKKQQAEARIRVLKKMLEFDEFTPEQRAFIEAEVSGKKFVPPVKQPPKIERIEAEVRARAEVKPLKPFKSLEGLPPGKKSTVATPKGTKVETEFRVVDVDEIITSDKPEFIPEFQPRDRTRITSQEQINKIASDRDLERLAESATSGEGAPIVGADRFAESGNARIIASKLALEEIPGEVEKTRKFLTDNAERFGITTEQTNNAKKPILIRVRKTQLSREDRIKFIQESNESTVQRLGAAEQAQLDAKKMKLKVTDKIGDEVDVTTNPDFVRAFLDEVVSFTDRNAMVDPNGRLTGDGVKRINNAIAAKAYGDDVDFIVRLAESKDDNIKNINKAIIEAGPQIAAMNEFIAKQGGLESYNISKSITGAAQKLSELRKKGTNIKDFIKNEDLFQGNKAFKELLQVYDDYKTNPQRIREILLRYAKEVESMNKNQPGLLTDKFTAQEILKSLRREEDGLIPRIEENQPVKRKVPADAKKGQDKVQTGEQKPEASKGAEVVTEAEIIKRKETRLKRKLTPAEKANIEEELILHEEIAAAKEKFGRDLTEDELDTIKNAIFVEKDTILDVPPNIKEPSAAVEAAKRGGNEDETLTKVSISRGKPKGVFSDAGTYAETAASKASPEIIELPELVEIAHNLSGKYPKVVRKIGNSRSQQIKGKFNSK